MANLVKRSGRVNIRVGGNSQETAVMVQNTSTGALIVKGNDTQGTVSHPQLFTRAELNNAPDSNSANYIQGGFNIYDGQYFEAHKRSMVPG